MTNAVPYSEPLSGIIDIEHELLVRYLSRTEVGSLEDLGGNRSVPPEIPAVNLRAPTEGCIED